MDGQTVTLIFLIIGAASGEYSERGGGATSFAQYSIFSKQHDSPDGPQYRPFAGFNKDVSAPFPLAEKNSPFPVRVPLADRPVSVHVPKPYAVPVATQVPFALDRPVSYPVNVIPQVPVQQPFGKQPYHAQPYQHQDGGYNPHYNPHLQ